MIEIYNTITRVGGSPLVGVIVTISLAYDKTTLPVAMKSDDQTMIRSEYTTLTDDNGLWEAELAPNADILPGSLYRVSERSSITDTPVVYFIEVPSMPTPAPTWTGDIIVASPPAWAV